MKTVKVGERLAIDVGLGKEATTWDCTVGESCGGAGYWYCTDCRDVPAHNVAAHSHADRGHTLAWLCFEHGPEVP